MAFWKNFGFITHSAIEEILDKPDFTLEDLLGESELLQEIKHNTRLIEFVSKPEQLEKLLGYAIRPPEADEKRSNSPYTVSKTPWNGVACEIICAESPQISNSFFEHPPLIEKILDVLSDVFNTKEDQKLSTNERDILLAILSKILLTYLSKKPSVIINAMKKRNNILDVLTGLLYNRDVIEVLLRLIEENTEGTSQWFIDNNLIEQLISKFDPSFDSEIYVNVAYTLERIITLVADRSLSSPILNQLEQSTTIQKILDFGFPEVDDPKAKRSLLNGLTVIIKLIEINDQDHDNSEKSPVAIYNVCEQYLDRFLSILEFNKPDTMINMTTGRIEPFGYLRMKIMQLLEALISSKHEPTIALLLEKNVFKIILDLFFHFEWNNFLHLRVYSIVKSILEGTNELVKNFLLVECQLIERLVKAHEDSLKGSTDQNKATIKKGYVGTLIEILLLVWKHQNEENNSIEEIVKSNEIWKKYVEEHKEIYEDLLSEKKLGKLPSIQSASDDDIYHENNDPFNDNDEDWEDSDSDEYESEDSDELDLNINGDEEEPNVDDP